MLGELLEMKNKKLCFALLAVSAILTGLTLVFPAIGFLEWLTLVPACLFLFRFASDEGVRLRTLYGWGCLFFYCYYLTTFHWFLNLYPLDFVDGMTKGGALAVVLVAWLGLSLLQTLFGGLLFVLCGTLFRTYLVRKHSLLRPFLLGLLWAVYEWTQTLGWWGVPWGRLPLGQAKYLVGLQTASLLGPYFITFLLVSVNALAAMVLLALIRKERPMLKLSCFLIAGILLLQYGVGTILWFCRAESERTVTVAVVKGNISSQEKWSTASDARTDEVYEQYTREAAAAGAEIVVWPETAFPYTVTPRNSLGRFISKLARQTETTILVGAFSEAEDGYYNAVLCFLPDGTMSETVYAKRRLVPFGEFVPFQPLVEAVIPPLAELVLSGGVIVEGEGANVFALEKGNVGSLVCFDSIYEDLTRESVLGGAEMLALSTNDSWFTDSAALSMHNAQAQLRAIESGRYLARSANTGISTVISDRGEVLCSLDPLVDGMLVEEIAVKKNITLYTRIGNAFVYLAIAFLGFLVADELWRRKVK